jgi:hypothetical protein
MQTNGSAASRTTQGLLVGALGGAGLAMLRGQNMRSVFREAVNGASIGALAGNLLDSSLSSSRGINDQQGSYRSRTFRVSSGDDGDNPFMILMRRNVNMVGSGGSGGSGGTTEQPRRLNAQEVEFPRTMEFIHRGVNPRYIMMMHRNGMMGGGSFIFFVMFTKRFTLILYILP